jgi:hypothetical protein
VSLPVIDHRVTRRLRALDERLVRELQEKHVATEPARLRLLDPLPHRAGSKPLIAVVDDRGVRYVLKLAEPALARAEQAAYELRRLGRRPCIPARVVTTEVEGIGWVEGLLKPYLDFDPQAELQTDTSQWSDLQRYVLLREHAWEWFLDNLDTNTSQYALLGPEGYPLNIDWDRAFADDGCSELSRFAKYRKTLPNARTFLYADFVEGRGRLPFGLLREEARRIRRLPKREVRRIIAEYAATRFDNASEAERFVSRVLRRQQDIEVNVARFIRSIEAERRDLTGLVSHERTAAIKVPLAKAWRYWQLFLNWLARGPVGTLARSVLKLVRGMGARKRRLTARVPSRI